MKIPDELIQARIWNRYASAGYLQSTIDPRDSKGLKCDYIDRWSRFYIRKFVLCKPARRVLEIGCGSGRNLFPIAHMVDEAYGVDVAQNQLANARTRRALLGLANVHLADSSQGLFESGLRFDAIFTMWVLAHVEDDDNLHLLLQSYLRLLQSGGHMVFFEQVAAAPYTVKESGEFYKKVRTVEHYESIFRNSSLQLCDTHVICEKGFGPIYKRLYLSPLYNKWPAWLNINAMIFPIDRSFVRRYVRSTFTDLVFRCKHAE